MNAKQETWRIGGWTHTKFIDGECWPVFEDEGGRWVALFATEAEAEQAIADHEARQEAVEALEAIIGPYDGEMVVEECIPMEPHSRKRVLIAMAALDKLRGKEGAAP